MGSELGPSSGLNSWESEDRDRGQLQHHKAEGLDRRVDLPRIAEVLREIDADLVGIQEIYLPQAEALAAELGMSMAMGATRHYDRVPYGNAVFTRFPVHGSHQFDLSRPPREPRGGIRLDAVVGGGARSLFNVHFGLKIRERAHQWRRSFASRFSTTSLRPSRGDRRSNEWFPGAVGRAPPRASGPRIRRTHPARSHLRLDRIYWDRALDAEGFHVHRSRLARVASDHLPVVARLGLTTRAG